METKKMDGKALLEQAKKAKQRNQTKSFQKIVGKDKKDKAKFRIVNFNG
ncbi:MAG: hypothetical protein ACRDBX_08735 [Erysipelotrichaceae bacterium]